MKVCIIIDNTDGNPKLVGVARSQLGRNRMLRAAYAMDEHADIVCYDADVGCCYIAPCLVEYESEFDDGDLFDKLDELQRIVEGGDAE